MTLEIARHMTDTDGNPQPCPRCHRGEVVLTDYSTQPVSANDWVEYACSRGCGYVGDSLARGFAVRFTIWGVLP